MAWAIYGLIFLIAGIVLRLVTGAPEVLVLCVVGAWSLLRALGNFAAAWSRKRHD